MTTSTTTTLLPIAMPTTIANVYSSFYNLPVGSSYFSQYRVFAEDLNNVNFQLIGMTGLITQYYISIDVDTLEYSLYNKFETELTKGIAIDTTTESFISIIKKYLESLQK